MVFASAKDSDEDFDPEDALSTDSGASAASLAEDSSEAEEEVEPPPPGIML